MLGRARLGAGAELRPDEPAVELAPPIVPDGSGYRLAYAREADRSQQHRIARRLRRQARRIARLEELATEVHALTGLGALILSLFVFTAAAGLWMTGRIELSPMAFRVLLEAPETSGAMRLMSRFLFLAVGTNALVQGTVRYARRRWEASVAAVGLDPAELRR